MEGSGAYTRRPPRPVSPPPPPTFMTYSMAALRLNASTSAVSRSTWELPTERICREGRS